MARFVNPFTDFGFKKIFGEEASKPQLKDFLNSMLPANHQIEDLTFRNIEKLGAGEYDRKAIYDIHCESSTGEKFIVELLKAKHNFFKDRTVYYSTFPIQEQAERGDWDYRLDAVYCIGILDFVFGDPDDDEAAAREVVHRVQLKDQHHKVFYDKLMYIYLEMPNFSKREDELETRLDKWLYFLRHLEDLDKIPEIFGKEPTFAGAFSKAEVAALPPEDYTSYQQSLKIYRDLKVTIDTSYEDGLAAGLEKGEAIGLEKGKAEGLEEALKRMVATGMKDQDARKILGM